MSYLLAIAVGPVQEFIAAARRTRDLWFGSYLLSEVSRDVANSVEKNGGKLIFPATTNAENVANVILGELQEVLPRDIVASAKQAADNCWKRFATQARKTAANAIQEEVWDSQLNDVIELYAAWVVRTDNYRKDRASLMRLLAGRKNCRDFQQSLFEDKQLPKSSLDGQRTSVFVQPKSRSSRDELRRTWPVALRLSPGEELDIVGVTKRLGIQPDETTPHYPSVARVAAETWLSGLRERNQQGLAALEVACKELVKKGLSSVGEKKYQYFPYEGTVIFKDRHADLQSELNRDESALDTVKAALNAAGGEPRPDLAVLVADGDRMGASISRLESPNDHRKFSTALAGFADDAKRIVTKHCGVLVYAGGDDVLAFLPVDQCLKCAKALSDRFAALLAGYMSDEEKSPTLSVGIAIGHFMENLEDLLEYGRAAEKAAKKVKDKNALAVHLHKRGGAPIRIRDTWSNSPETRLERFAGLMNDGTIPTRLPYDLRTMARVYEGWEDADAAIRLDLIRLIVKKKKKDRGDETVRQALHNDLVGMDSEKLSILADELLVARLIAEAMQQANSHKEKKQ